MGARGNLAPLHILLLWLQTALNGSSRKPGSLAHLFFFLVLADRQKKKLKNLTHPSRYDILPNRCANNAAFLHALYGPALRRGMRHDQK